MYWKIVVLTLMSASSSYSWTSRHNSLSFYKASPRIPKSLRRPSAFRSNYHDSGHRYDDQDDNVSYERVQEELSESYSSLWLCQVSSESQGPAAQSVSITQIIIITKIIISEAGEERVRHWWGVQVWRIHLAAERVQESSLCDITWWILACSGGQVVIVQGVPKKTLKKI